MLKRMMLKRMIVSLIVVIVMGNVANAGWSIKLEKGHGYSYVDDSGGGEANATAIAAADNYSTSSSGYLKAVAYSSSSLSTEGYETESAEAWACPYVNVSIEYDGPPPAPAITVRYTVSGVGGFTYINGSSNCSSPGDSISSASGASSWSGPNNDASLSADGQSNTTGPSASCEEDCSYSDPSWLWDIIYGVPYAQPSVSGYGFNESYTQDDEIEYEETGITSDCSLSFYAYAGADTVVICLDEGDSGSASATASNQSEVSFYVEWEIEDN